MTIKTLRLAVSFDIGKLILTVEGWGGTARADCVVSKYSKRCIGEYLGNYKASDVEVVVLVEERTLV
jgi:hypothetical protein